jgi:hypothetical protein
LEGEGYTKYNLPYEKRLDQEGKGGRGFSETRPSEVKKTEGLNKDRAESEGWAKGLRGLRYWEELERLYKKVIEGQTFKNWKEMNVKER